MLPKILSFVRDGQNFFLFCHPDVWPPNPSWSSTRATSGRKRMLGDKGMDPLRILVRRESLIFDTAKVRKTLRGNKQGMRLYSVELYVKDRGWKCNQG